MDTLYDLINAMADAALLFLKAFIAGIGLTLGVITVGKYSQKQTK